MTESNNQPTNLPPPVQPPVPPPLPPQIAPPLRAHASPVNVIQPPESPEERVPIRGLLATIETVLRQPQRVMFHLSNSDAGRVIAALLAIAAVSALIYGVVVGTFSGAEQLWLAPAKISIGLLLSALICLPSLYIINCLSGSKARLLEVCGLLAAAGALTTILLVGFAPVAWVFSQSTESVVAMGGLHLLFWTVASYFGFRFMVAGLLRFRGTLGIGFTLWSTIFLMVVLQMSTALRPIIGKDPHRLPTEKKFFLAHWSECLLGPDEAKAAGSAKAEGISRSTH